MDIIARGYMPKRAKRTMSAVTGTSTMLVESADVPPPSRLTLKKGKSVERVLPCNWSEEVNLGKGVSLNLDPAFFEAGEDFGLTVDVDDIRKEGLPTIIGDSTPWSSSKRTWVLLSWSIRLWSLPWRT